jgi:hypothetical protein
MVLHTVSLNNAWLRKYVNPIFVPELELTNSKNTASSVSYLELHPDKCPTFVSALVNPVFLWCPCSSFCFPCFYFQLLVFVLSISASITHPPLHSYIFKSRKVLAVIQETKDQRKKEIIIVF